MSFLHESGHDDQQLIRYLLGLLPDEDAERLDEASIVDDEVADRLREVENDLVDAYLNGTLAGESLERFESFYLSSPRRRQKVRFARSLLRTVNRSSSADADSGGHPLHAAAVEDKTVSSRPSSSNLRVVPRPKPIWRLAAVAALLLLACGTLFLRDVRLRNGLTDAQRQSAALDRRAHELERQLADQRAANAESTRELAGVRASLAALAQNSPGRSAEQAGSASRALATIAVVLMPQTRSVGPVAAVTVPQGTERVRFELRLESNEFAEYQVTLKDPGTNQTVWRSGRLAAQSSGNQPAVSVMVPVTLLKPQHYSLELAGLGAAGDAQIVGGYAVRIGF